MRLKNGFPLIVPLSSSQSDEHRNFRNLGGHVEAYIEGIICPHKNYPRVNLYAKNWWETVPPTPPCIPLALQGFVCVGNILA